VYSDPETGPQSDINLRATLTPSRRRTVGPGRDDRPMDQCLWIMSQCLSVSLDELTAPGPESPERDVYRERERGREGERERELESERAREQERERDSERKRERLGE
jgi:hypothetical protein